MADRIVHFGTDDCHRALVLTNTGYEVADCGTSLKALESALQENEFCAIAISEDHTRLAEQAAITARSLTAVPIILFEGAARRYDSSNFDHIIERGTPPPDWLRQFAAVVDRSRATREQSRNISRESAFLQQQSAGTRAIARSGRERAQAERARSKELTQKRKEE